MATKKHPPADLSNTIRYIKAKGFEFIKVELEADLNRGRSNSSNCPRCDGRGYEEILCPHCDDDGEVSDEDDNYVPCGTCDGDNRTQGDLCDLCDGTGRNEEETAYTSEIACKKFIREHISEQAQSAIVFDKFYRDGSVDSEYTFTIPINKIKLLPEFIQAFKLIGDRTGTLQTTKAGMHISLLMNGVLGRGQLDQNKLVNFKREMPKLLPALFFLSSVDFRSRALRYRLPRVDTDKYSAIKVGPGHLEYRLFETCYQQPEAILEYIETIKKTLQFYGTNRVNRKCFDEFTFPEGDHYTQRFYNTKNNLEALEAGLEYLKPKGKSVTQLKKQRGIAPNAAHKGELKIKLRYNDYVACREEEISLVLRRELQKIIPNKDTRALYKTEVDSALFMQYRKQLLERVRQDVKIVPFETWVQRQSKNRGWSIDERGSMKDSSNGSPRFGSFEWQ